MHAEAPGITLLCAKVVLLLCVTKIAQVDQRALLSLEPGDTGSQTLAAAMTSWYTYQSHLTVMTDLACICCT